MARQTTSQPLLSSTVYTVKVSGGDYTSIQAAVNDIATKRFHPSAAITIQVDDGIWTSGTAVDWFPHTCRHSHQVILAGTTTYSKSMTSVISCTGSVGAYSLVIALNNVTNIAIGDVVSIPKAATGGTNPKAVPGAYPVTNVDVGNSRITLDYKARFASFLPSGAITATVTVYKTVLKFTNSHGIVVPINGTIGDIKNIAIIGDYTASRYGLDLREFSTALITSDTLAMCNFGGAIRASRHSTLTIVGVYTSNCVADGINITYGGQGQVGVVSSCNGSIGLVLNGVMMRMAISTNFGISTQNNVGNVYAAYGTLFHGQSFQSYYSNSNGIYVNRGAVAILYAAHGVNSSNYNLQTETNSTAWIDSFTNTGGAGGGLYADSTSQNATGI